MNKYTDFNKNVFGLTVNLVVDKEYDHASIDTKLQNFNTMAYAKSAKQRYDYVKKLLNKGKTFNIRGFFSNSNLNEFNTLFNVCCVHQIFVCKSYYPASKPAKVFRRVSTMFNWVYAQMFVIYQNRYILFTEYQLQEITIKIMRLKQDNRENKKLKQAYDYLRYS